MKYKTCKRLESVCGGAALGSFSTIFAGLFCLNPYLIAGGFIGLLGVTAFGFDERINSFHNRILDDTKRCHGHFGDAGAIVAEELRRGVYDNYEI